MSEQSYQQAFFHYSSMILSVWEHAVSDLYMGCMQLSRSSYPLLAVIPTSFGMLDISCLLSTISDLWYTTHVYIHLAPLSLKPSPTLTVLLTHTCTHTSHPPSHRPFLHTHTYTHTHTRINIADSLRNLKANMYMRLEYTQCSVQYANNSYHELQTNWGTTN